MSVDQFVEPVEQEQGLIHGVVTGTLVGFAGDGRVPLVAYPGQPDGAAVAADSVLDLHGAHIDRRVVLMFESGDPRRPIVMGLLRPEYGYSVPTPAGSVEVDLDGERLTVTARQQLVLRCGRASITLTRAGKVLINGTYLSSRATGVNRLMGGSIQLN